MVLDLSMCTFMHGCAYKRVRVCAAMHILVALCLLSVTCTQRSFCVRLCI